MLKINNPRIMVLADQAVFSGASFVSTFLAARQMEPSDFGWYSGIFLMLYLFVNLSNALVIQPFQVSAPRATDAKDYVNFAFWLQLVIVLVLMVGVAMVFRIDVELPAIDGAYVVFTCAAFLMHDFFRKVFLARAEIWKALVVDVVSAAIQLAVLVYMFSYSVNLTLTTFLQVTIASFGAGVMLGIALLHPETGAIAAWPAYLRDHLRQGRWLLLTGFVQWWSGNFLVIALGMFVGPVALGAFRLAQSLFGVLNIVFQTYENYALPQAVRLFQESQALSRTYLRDISIRGGIAFGAVLSLLAVFADEVVVLAGGEKYEDFGYVIQGMALLYFIIFMGYPVRMAIRLLVLNDVFFLGYLVSSLFSVFTCKILLEEYQVTGAIIGLIVNQVIVLLLWQYVLAKKKFIIWK